MFKTILVNAALFTLALAVIAAIALSDMARCPAGRFAMIPEIH